MSFPLQVPNSPDHPLSLILWTIQNMPQKIRVLSFAALIPSIKAIKIVKLRDPNTVDANGAITLKGTLGGLKRGKVTIMLPEEVARNLKGSDDKRDIYLLFHVDREAYERMKSPIILPGAKL